MRWRGILVLGVAVSALAFGIGSSGARTTVNDPVNYAGSVANCPPGAAPRYASVQVAINNIAPGGTVNVCHGNFAAPFTLPGTKPGVTIQGMTRLSLTVGCSATGTPTAAQDSVILGSFSTIFHAADNVTVKGLVFQTGGAGTGLSFVGSNGTVTQNLFLGNDVGLSFGTPAFQSASGETVSSNCFRSNTFAGVDSLWGLADSTIQ